MTFRRRLSVLAASSLLLTGCAVPGQDGAPGITATYGDTVVTSAEIDAIAAAWDKQSEGTAVPDRREIATYAVLGPELLAAAAEQGIVIGEADATAIAEAWFTFAGVVEPEASGPVVETTRALLALYVLAYGDATGEALVAVANRAEAEATFSPRVGEFSAEALFASVQQAISQAEAAQLGNYGFITFLDVSAFTDGDAAWAARG